MKLQDMIDWAVAGKIQELQLLSIEGGFYLARAQLADGSHTLKDSQGKSMHLRSATHLRDLLSDLPSSAHSFPCVLVQHTVHDEMCGIRTGPIEPLKVPFTLAAGW